MLASANLEPNPTATTIPLPRRATAPTTLPLSSNNGRPPRISSAASTGTTGQFAGPDKVPPYPPIGRLDRPNGSSNPAEVDFSFLGESITSTLPPPST